MNLLNWQFHDRNEYLTNYKLKKAKEDVTNGKIVQGAFNRSI